MKQAIGCRIITDFERPEQKLVEEFRGIPSGNIGDMMNRLYCMNSDVKAYSKKPLLGVAFTVKAPPGDNAFFHRAMDLAQPGDILVVDGGASMERALAGEMMFNYAQGRGIGGIIVNGCIRDIGCIDELDIPIYACGTTAQGPYKNGPGEIGVPVVCGGQVVCPGDILMGDVDGVVVIPRKDAPSIVDAAQKKYSDEIKKLEQYHAGEYDFAKHEEKFKQIAGL